MFVFVLGRGRGEEDLEEQLLLIQNEEGMGYIEGITVQGSNFNYLLKLASDYFLTC